MWRQHSRPWQDPIPTKAGRHSQTLEPSLRRSQQPHPRAEQLQDSSLPLGTEHPRVSPSLGDPRASRPGRAGAGPAAAQPRAGAQAQPKKARFGPRSQSSRRRARDARRNARHPPARARQQRPGTSRGRGSKLPARLSAPPSEGECSGREALGMLLRMGKRVKREIWMHSLW